MHNALVQNSGPRRSLILSRETLTFSTSCRFIPAHRTFTSRLSIMLGIRNEGRPKRRPSSFDVTQKRPRTWRLAGSGNVAAEDAEFAGGAADFGEGLVEPGNISCFDINEKLRFPGAAVKRADLHLRQIPGVPRKSVEPG